MDTWTNKPFGQTAYENFMTKLWENSEKKITHWDDLPQSEKNAWSASVCWELKAGFFWMRKVIAPYVPLIRTNLVGPSEKFECPECLQTNTCTSKICNTKKYYDEFHP